MTRKFVIAALLAGSAFIVCSGTACRAGAAGRSRSPSRPSPMRRTRPPTRRSQGTSQVDDLQAKIELLQAQVEALQEALEGVKTPAGQGRSVVEGRARNSRTRKRASRFKPQGLRCSMTPAMSAIPDGDELRGTVGGLNFSNLGFNTRARRILSAPKARSPAASATSSSSTSRRATVDYEDIILTYDFEKSPLQHHDRQFLSLFEPRDDDELALRSIHGARRRSPTRSTTTAASASACSSRDKTTDSYLVQAGIFSTPINDGTASTVPAGRLAARRLLADARLDPPASRRELPAPRATTSEAHRASTYRAPAADADHRSALHRHRHTSPPRATTSLGVEFGGDPQEPARRRRSQKVWVRNAYSAGRTRCDSTPTPDDNDAATGTALNGNPSLLGRLFRGSAISSPAKPAPTRAASGIAPRCSSRSTRAAGARSRSTAASTMSTSATASTAARIASPRPFYVNGGKQLGLSGQPDLEPDRLGPLHGPVRPPRRDRRPARRWLGRSSSDQAGEQAQVRRRYVRHPRADRVLS